MVVGVISPGAMGSAVGAAYAAAGHRVVATLAGRSDRTRGLAERAGIELLPDLDAVVAEAGLVLSIAPPGEAPAIAAALADAAERTGARPLVSDWNAVAPATVRAIEETLGAAGLDLVDGSISGGPPREDYRTRVYVSGLRASELVESAPPWLDLRLVGEEVGLASAVKMSTAAVYKGFQGLLAQALLTAEANGVLAEVLDDLHDSFPRPIERAGRYVADAAAKSGRFVGEMREIAAAQAAAGLTPALYDALAEVFAAQAGTAAAATPPEELPRDPDLREVLARLTEPADAGERT